ncbi:MAG: hypothetical protein JNK82_28410, partial [Myxococcaceae bacterium]|nr:hypothetical protein [Myxococcaceae bacterium]
MKRLAIVVVAVAAVLAGLYVVSREEQPGASHRVAAVELPAPRVVGPWSPPVTAADLTLTVVVKRAGRAVPGANVRLTRDGAALPGVTTGADGVASVKLAPGPVELAAEAEGATARRAVTLTPLVGDARVELELTSGAPLEVTALDAVTKRPLRGAHVEVHLSPTEPRRVLATADADEAGRVRVQGLPPNEYLVSVVLEGYVDSRNGIVRAPSTSERWLLPLQIGGGRVVLPDGQPAAGAEVTSTPLSWEKAESATADRDGRFTLPVSPNGARVCARLGALAGEGRLAADGGVVVLGPQRRFTGRVVRSEDDAPLEGVALRHAVGALVETAQTGADGGFTVGALCGEQPWVLFEHEGYVTEGALLEDGQTVALSAVAALRGRVVDDEGLPVANAHVELDDPSETTVSDADGRFGFLRVKREVRVSAEEGERGGSVDALVEAGQLVEVTVPVGPVLVKVPVEVLRDGAPAGGVWQVEAVRLDGRPWRRSTQWHAGGRVSDVVYATGLRMPAGSFRVTATESVVDDDEAGGSGSTEYRLELGGAEPAPIRVHAKWPPPKPPPAMRPLRVRVLGAGGEPIVDAGVYCSGANSGWAYTGADGRGACQLLADGELPVDVTARVGGAFAGAKPAGWEAEVLLQLKAGMTIRGRVTGDAGPDAFISLVSGVEVTGQPLQREFVFEDAPSVRSILCVQTQEVTHACAVVVPDGGVQAVTLAIGAPGTLRFTVFDARGQRVDEPVLYVDRMSRRVVTEQGVVTMSLAPGQHVVVVNVRDGPERWERVLNIESGKTVELGRV